jgi:hypothetical protein
LANPISDYLKSRFEILPSNNLPTLFHIRLSPPTRCISSLRGRERSSLACIFHLPVMSTSRDTCLPVAGMNEENHVTQSAAKSLFLKGNMSVLSSACAPLPARVFHPPVMSTTRDTCLPKVGLTCSARWSFQLPASSFHNPPPNPLRLPACSPRGGEGPH